MVAGLAASPGRYEGWARVVRQPTDFKKLRNGDVLVAPTTSPAYNVILPMIGAVVTDRGGALSHCAIVAREFGIPAVVGTDQATSRIPDGARILVDGDRGFVAVRA
jgi:pyruvate,water dikinase